MDLVEKRMNLFDVENKYYFAHCISSDCKMGLGIAVKFENRFRLRDRLLTLEEQLRESPTCILYNKVFNLITKDKYYSKPTYTSLRKSLQIMKYIAIKRNIKFIAMPRIGCGLDKLEWDRVRDIINSIFNDTDIEILVCNLKE